jgi:hypothetical protein
MSPPNESYLWVSLIAIELNNNTNSIPGKGHNETLEIVNSVEHTRAANGVIRGHVPENGGTCCSLSQLAFSFNVTVYYWLFYRIVKEKCDGCELQRLAFSFNVTVYY